MLAFKSITNYLRNNMKEISLKIKKRKMKKPSILIDTHEYFCKMS